MSEWTKPGAYRASPKDAMLMALQDRWQAEAELLKLERDAEAIKRKADRP